MTTPDLTREDARAIARILYAIDQRIAANQAAEQVETSETQCSKASAYSKASAAAEGGDADV